MDPTPHLERFESYQQACREFRPRIPERFNIAGAICGRHADAVTRIALSDVRDAGINTYTFGGLDFLSDKFAKALSDSGIDPGDSVGVMLRQSAALAVAHFGILKTGAVVVPLSMGIDGHLLEYALADSGAKSIVVDESMSGAVQSIARSLPNLKSGFVARDLRPAVTAPDFRDFWSEVDGSSSDFEPVMADANSRAFIFYVESNGKQPGVVHSHRSVIGQLAAFEMINNLEPCGDAAFWTAFDWSSARAVLGVLYPALWYGGSLVAGTLEDSANALRLMERTEVSRAFISSAQIETLAESDPQPHDRFALKLDTLVTDGPPSPELRHWTEEKLGVTLKEAYGTTETGWLAGGCERWFSNRIGSLGRAVPGRSIEVIDESARILPAGEIGRIAVHRSDPALFTEFHNASERTAASFIGDWFLTGESGYKSEDGDLFNHHPHT